MKTELLVAIIAGVIALGSAAATIWGQIRVTELERESAATVAKQDAEIRRSISQLASRTQREVINLQHESATRKPFLEHQLTLYLEASKITAMIATIADDSDPERQKAIRRFWQLYWGELVVVEDHKVANAMVAFGRALKSSDNMKLEQLALGVAHACRDSVQKSWDVDLGKTVSTR